MFRTIIKSVLFAAVVLLLGQIPVGQGETVAALFHREVSRVFFRSTDKLLQTKFMASMAPSFFTRWIHNTNPPPSLLKKKNDPSRNPGNATDTAEEYTTSDRESMLRLLP